MSRDGTYTNQGKYRNRYISLSFWSDGLRVIKGLPVVITVANMDGVKRWLRWVRKLYSLDTLDTRFTIPSNTPSRGAATELQIDPAKPGPSNGRINVAGQHNGSQALPGAGPSLWNTTEFYFYYFWFLTLVPIMIYVPYSVSKRTYSLLLYRKLPTDYCIKPLTLAIPDIAIFCLTAGSWDGK